MRILISGASGLIGFALLLRLRELGHEVRRLVRSEDVPEDAIGWDPAHGRLDPRSLEGLDAVVHLAGENVAKGRWTEGKMRRIRDSRIDGTRLLVTRLLEVETPPSVFIAASAIGAYGDRSDRVVTEDSHYGTGFLCDVCRRWEDASRPLEDKNTRVVHLRIGLVLSPEGGALAKMIPPFRLCLGGVIGDGNQYMSWLTLKEVCSIIEFVIEDAKVSGPVNAVSPNPVTNREFTETLGKVLGRPTVLPLPAFAARLLFGRMADELLLASTRVEPARLRAAGYRFRHPDLEPALRGML